MRTIRFRARLVCSKQTNLGRKESDFHLYDNNYWRLHLYDAVSDDLLEREANCHRDINFVMLMQQAREHLTYFTYEH